jgi:uncharacterized protein YukE
VSRVGDVAGAVVQAVVGQEKGPAGALGDSPSAPVPSVGSRPRRIAVAAAWSAPDAGGSGQLTVHRDVLREVAGHMRADLRDLDAAVQRLGRVRQGGGISITVSGGLTARWPTAAGFDANASSACAGVMQASQQTGDAHQDTSRRLADSASTYDDHEADNLRAIRGIYSVGTHLNAVTGMVAAYGRGGRGNLAAPGGIPRHAVKTRAVSAFSGAGMSAAEIMRILRGLDPGAIQEAAAAHTSLGDTLNAVAGRLAGNAGTLAQNWSGGAAQAAMGQFQQLHQQMVTLAQQALQVGSVLSWLGHDVLPPFKTLPDPSAAALLLSGAAAGAAADGAGGVLAGGVLAGGAAGETVGAVVGAAAGLAGGAQAAADRQARQYIAKLSGYLVQANQALPDAIGGASSGRASSGLGGAGRGGGKAAVAGAGAGAAGAGSALAAAGITGAGVSGGGLTAGAGVRAAVPGDAATLQSAAPPNAGAGPSAAGTGSPAPEAGPAGLGGPSPVAGVPLPPGSPVTGQPADADGPDGAAPGAPGLSGAVVEAAGLPGPGVPGSAMDGAATDGVAGAQALTADGPLAAGAEAGQAPSGMAAFPMMGVGPAQPGQERNRQAFLTEDADMWGLQAGLVPAVIERGG